MVYRILAIMCLLLVKNTGATQSINDGFSPSVNDSIRKLITLNSGHILVGGTFTQVTQGRTQAYLAAFNNDGSLFEYFSPELNGVVNDMVLQPDGKILVAGAFTQVDGALHPYLVRLHTNGTPDATFSPVLNASVQAVALHADGRITIGGQFPGKLRRLNSDGSFDATFQAQLDAQALISDIQVNMNNQAVVGGEFSTVNGMSKSNLVRLLQDGSVDTNFNPVADPDWPVRILLHESNGAVIVGGEFTAIGGQNQAYLARFNPSGELDSGFDVTINGPVLTITAETSGNLIIGGEFTVIDNQSAVRIARLNTLTNVVTFAQGYEPDAMVTASTVLGDGDVIIGGEFLQLGLEARTRLARLHHIRGTLDQTLMLSTSGGNVQTMARKPNGNYILAGGFTGVNGMSTDNIIELTADGHVVDNSHFASTNGAFINSIMIDGINIYLGGDFTTVDGQPRQRLAKLLFNGGLNTSFNCPVNGTVYALAKWNDHILVAGSFSEINGVTQQNLAMINSQCAVNSSFNVTVTGGVIRSVLVQPNGQILLGGGFTAVNGFNRNRVARLLMVGMQGFVDGFDPDPDGTVTTMSLLKGGEVMIAGDFDQVSSQARRGLALLNSDGSVSTKLNLPLGIGEDVYSMAPLANGRVMLAGNFTVIDGISKNRVAMIKPNLFNAGNYHVVNDFTVDANQVVRSLFPTQNGKVFMLGAFTDINGESRVNVARISQSAFAREVLIANGNQLNWRQYGSTPLQSRPPIIDIRENGGQIVAPSAMQYNSNTGYWQKSIDSSPFSDTPIDFIISGNYSTGYNNNSTATRYINIYRVDYSDLIFANGFSE